jgi:hypothetical protein
MEQSDPSLLTTWKNLKPELRKQLLDELGTLARAKNPHPSELLDEAGRIAYAIAHSKADLVKILTHKTNG